MTKRCYHPNNLIENKYGVVVPLGEHCKDCIEEERHLNKQETKDEIIRALKRKIRDLETTRNALMAFLLFSIIFIVGLLLSGVQ